MHRAPEAATGTVGATALSACSWLQWHAFAASHPALPGHFPGRPVIPGVVLLEVMQAMLLQHLPGWTLAQLPMAKFLRAALPDEPLLMGIEFTSVDAARIAGRWVCRSAGLRPALTLAQGNFVLLPASPPSGTIA